LFKIAYALYKGRCALVEAFREASTQPSGFEWDEAVGRFFGIRLNGGCLEGCLRISYASINLLELLLDSLRRRDVYCKPVYRGRGNVVVKFKHRMACSFCPVIHSTGGAVPKAILVTPIGLLFELVVDDNDLDEEAFEILAAGSPEEMMDYMLTPREQEVLYYAYFRGYYDTPRRVSLEELSRELGIAKSTLNEMLRSAERKIVTAYMRHDLPHLILRRVLERTQRLKLKMQSPT